MPAATKLTPASRGVMAPSACPMTLRDDSLVLAFAFRRECFTWRRPLHGIEIR
jgi:hypothetical protein